MLLASAGCANPGDPPVEPDPITVDAIGGRISVTAPSYTMEFASTGILMPEHLIVEGVDVLGIDGCNAENRVGVSTYPATNASAGEQGIASRSTIERLLEGPLIAKIRVTYEVDYLCPGAQTLAGETLFTMFPNGRIVREDRDVTPSTSKLGLSTPCGCHDSDPPSNLFFTSFWAFDPDGATEVDSDGDATTGGLSQACTIYDDRAIGVAWSGDTTRIRPNRASAHVFTWVADSATLDTTPQSVFSAIEISTEGGPPSRCGDILADLADPPIRIGDVVLGSTGVDGIYRDEVVHDTRFEIATAGDPIPPSFAVSLDLAGASHVAFTRDPPVEGEIALIQRDPASDRVLVVFPHALQGDERITIEPRF